MVSSSPVEELGLGSELEGVGHEFSFILAYHRLVGRRCPPPPCAGRRKTMVVMTRPGLSTVLRKSTGTALRASFTFSFIFCSRVLENTSQVGGADLVEQQHGELCGSPLQALGCPPRSPRTQEARVLNTTVCFSMYSSGTTEGLAATTRRRRGPPRSPGSWPAWGCGRAHLPTDRVNSMYSDMSRAISDDSSPKRDTDRVLASSGLADPRGAEEDAAARRLGSLRRSLAGGWPR